MAALTKSFELDETLAGESDSNKRRFCCWTLVNIYSEEGIEVESNGGGSFERRDYDGKVDNGAIDDNKTVALTY